VRYWQFGLGGALLVWILGTAYLQARRRRRRMGLALLFLAAAVVCFAGAVFLPQPPLTATLSSALVVASIIALALAMAVILWHGFR
jgi:uncharacterized membrane-anchored protein YitT (DUF2179 family)